MIEMFEKLKIEDSSVTLCLFLFYYKVWVTSEGTQRIKPCLTCKDTFLKFGTLIGFCALQNNKNNTIQILMVWELCSINALSMKILSVYTVELHCIKVSTWNVSSLQNFVFSHCLHFLYI